MTADCPQQSFANIQAMAVLAPKADGEGLNNWSELLGPYQYIYS